MLQKKETDDYVVATGITRSVREFVEEAFKCVNIKIAWKGKKDNEIGYNKKTKDVLVKIDPAYYRPAEVNVLKGDFRKARKILGWKPKKKFKDIVKEMVLSDLKNLDK